MTGFIYKITNTINNKVYIGKTVRSIEERWSEHKQESKRSKNRPLYRAINKYGVENFSIEQIEECDIKILSNREIYWIEFYHSYSNGYNATLGGDGKILYDYDLIRQLIEQGYYTSDICEQLGCGPDLVRNIAKKSNIKLNSRNIFNDSKISVIQYDKNMNFIQSFNSYADAARWLEENGYVDGNLNGVRSHIGEVCNGKRKSAYGFIWAKQS